MLVLNDFQQSHVVTILIQKLSGRCAGALTLSAKAITRVFTQRNTELSLLSPYAICHKKCE